MSYPLTFGWRARGNLMPGNSPFSLTEGRSARDEIWESTVQRRARCIMGRDPTCFRLHVDTFIKLRDNLQIPLNGSVMFLNLDLELVSSQTPPVHRWSAVGASRSLLWYLFGSSWWVQAEYTLPTMCTSFRHLNYCSSVLRILVCESNRNSRRAEGWRSISKEQVRILRKQFAATTPGQQSHRPSQPQRPGEPHRHQATHAKMPKSPRNTVHLYSTASFNMFRSVCRSLPRTSARATCNLC